MCKIKYFICDQIKYQSEHNNYYVISKNIVMCTLIFFLKEYLCHRNWVANKVSNFAHLYYII